MESDPTGLRAGLNTYAYVYQSPLAYSDFRGLGVMDDLGDWISRNWSSWWRGKGGDIGKKMSVDAIGRIQGAKCALQCSRFSGSGDKYLKATEICFELMPETQADILTGNAVLDSCAKHCLRLLPENCKTSCPYR